MPGLADKDSRTEVDSTPSEKSHGAVNIEFSLTGESSDGVA